MNDITPKEIIAEYIVLMQLIQEDSDWQLVESYSDCYTTHLMVERIYTPDWMDDQFVFTYEDSITRESFSGSVSDVIRRFGQPAKLYRRAIELVGA